MGFYADVILPYCIDLTCGAKDIAPEREKVCAGLHGRVLEIGFGSGLNVPYYRGAVREVRGVDPSARALRIARERLRGAECKIDMVGLDAQRIDVEDAWADTALSTFTLCTIPDAKAALVEVGRILKPGGTLHFLEHGRARDATVVRWQDRLNGVQRLMAGGCCLNRDIAGLVRGAGFTIDQLDTHYLPGSPRTHAFLYRGVATRG